MTHRRLVHRNPNLNEKTMWYRVVADFPQLLHYLVIIVGPQGVINSAVHAVPREDYTIEIEQPSKEGERGKPARDLGKPRGASAKEDHSGGGSADEFI